MAASPTARLDTLLKVETPEAVDIYLRPASVFSRCRAYLADLLIRFVWFLASSWVLFGSGGTANEKFLLMLLFLNLFFTVWLYYVVFEMVFNGKTPGKMMFGLRVLNDNGTRITWSASLLRNLVRLVDGMPFLYCLGGAVSLWHPHGKRLGDILAATVVVYDDKSRAKGGERLNLRGIEAVPPPVALTREEQQAVLDFAERRGRLSAARAEELAQMLAESVFGGKQADAQALILGLAKYYAGDDGRTGG